MIYWSKLTKDGSLQRSLVAKSMEECLKVLDNLEGCFKDSLKAKGTVAVSLEGNLKNGPLGGSLEAKSMDP